MRAHLLVMHRKESYDGEFAPEVLAVCDEWAMEENPDWWAGEVARQRDLVGSDAAAWAEVVVCLDTDELMKALYPRPQVAVSVESSTSLPLT